MSAEFYKNLEEGINRDLLSKYVTPQLEAATVERYIRVCYDKLGDGEVFLNWCKSINAYIQMNHINPHLGLKVYENKISLPSVLVKTTTYEYGPDNLSLFVVYTYTDKLVANWSNSFMKILSNESK